MTKTYEQLQREVLDPDKGEKYLHKRIGKHAQELLEAQEKQKVLILQYERIIKGWKRQYEDVLDNAWKLLFAKILYTYEQLRKKGNEHHE